MRRSGELETELASFLELRPQIPGPRAAASKHMFIVAFEHGHSIRLLIAEGSLTSAFGLLRLQYEALVRGVWLISAASDEAVRHIHRDLAEESPERLPMVTDMLKSLPGHAPPGVLATLEDFRAKTLKPLNSVVHSGAHAFQRSVVGYSEQSVRQILVASNGLQALAAFEVVSIAGEPNAAVRLHGLQTTYGDCLPDHAF